jgi:hypothetical protein
MRYLQALEQKGLKKEELSKQTQKKIAELEKKMAEVKEDEDDFEDDDLRVIKKMINQVDEELEKSILKFNPEIYAKKKAVFEKNKYGDKAKVEEVKAVEIEFVEDDEEGEEYEEYEEYEEDAVEVVEQPKVERELIGNGYQIEQSKVEQPKVEQPTEQSKSVLSKLEELEQKVKINSEKFKAEQPQPQPQQQQRQRQQPEQSEEAEEVEVEEIENFKNKGTIKPKKMSTAIILMGVGAFLLTWGAVNFFKERR